MIQAKRSITMTPHSIKNTTKCGDINTLIQQHTRAEQYLHNCTPTTPTQRSNPGMLSTISRNHFVSLVITLIPSIHSGLQEWDFGRQKWVGLSYPPKGNYNLSERSLVAPSGHDDHGWHGWHSRSEPARRGETARVLIGGIRTEL